MLLFDINTFVTSSSKMLHVLPRPKQVVATAREVFNSGFTREVNYRLKQLKNFKKFLREHEEEIIECMYHDMRKHREEARLEVIIGINHLKYLISNLEKWVRTQSVPKRIVDLFDRLYTYNEPYGVVLIMGSWNVPLLTLLPVAGAIAAGNCVVIKPSHNSSNFGEMLYKRLPKFLDPDPYPVFLGDIGETQALLEERFDYIYYTGSTKVGRIVHLAANKYLTPTTLELGGKNPVYIDSSADMKLTASRVMWSKCFNAGQTCLAPDYVLCTKEVEKKFLRHARNALVRFYGDELLESCPIVNNFHFQRITKLMAGLNIAMGGRADATNLLIEPTIAIDVQLTDAIMQEEVFGPVLAIVTVDSLEAAVKIINKKEKPLAMYIFTKNASMKRYFLENTSAGSVTVNDTMVQLVVENLPFGGVGVSGMGRYKGKDSFETFSNKKSVLEKNFWGILEKIGEKRYPPYSARKVNFLAFLLKYRKGPSWGIICYLVVFLLGLIVGILGYTYYQLIKHVT